MYRLIQQLARYDDRLEHKLHHMAKQKAVQMKHRAISEKEPLVAIVLLQVFK